MAITRTPIVNDSGGGLDGTGLDNAWKQELYDQIDAALATAGGGLLTGPRCIAYATAAQSVASGAFAVLTLNAEDVDTAAMHDLVTNNSRITIPVAQGGLYFVRGGSRVAGYAGGTQVSFAVLKNGVQVAGETHANVAPAAQDLSVSKFLVLVAGDYLELAAYQDSGGAVNVGAAGSRNIASELSVIRVA